MIISQTWTKVVPSTGKRKVSIQNCTDSMIEVGVTSTGLPPTIEEDSLKMGNMDVKPVALEVSEELWARSIYTDKGLVMILNFNIARPESGSSGQGEKGDKGDKGDQGIQGIQGIQGEKGDPAVINGVSGSNITLSDLRVTTDTTSRLLPSDYIIAEASGKFTIYNAKGWLIYGSNKDGLCETYVNGNNVKQVFHASNGSVYESYSIDSSTWSDWKIRCQGHSLSLRRAPATNNIVLNTPLQLIGTRLVDGDSIELPTDTTIRVKGGKKYKISVSNLYVQTSAEKSASNLVLQTSSDGTTWTNTSLTRPVVIDGNNDTIDTTIGFVLYPQELVGGYGWTYFRILPTYLDGGIKYDVVLEIQEV